MRLIDADALLNGFDVHWVTEYDEAGFGMEYKAVPVGAIENAPTIDATPKWISVKAGLPKAFKDVDIAFGNADSIGFYSNVSKRWYITKGGNGVPVHGVHHWKYRDEPPKEDT